MSDKPTNEEVGALFLGEEPEAAEVEEGGTEFVEAAEEELPAGDDLEVTPEVEGDESEVEAEAEESPEDIVEVEWDGRLIEAPKAIADALMRQSDYTKKTQDVAAQRKEAEYLIEQNNNIKVRFDFAESIQPDMLEIQQLQAEVKQYEEYISANATQMDAQQIAVAQLEMKRRESAIAEKQNGLSNKYQEFQQAQEQSRQELLNKGTEILRSHVPSWGESEQQQVRDYALKLGFTEAEINNVSYYNPDARQVLALWKASQYDALKAGSAPAVKQVKEAPAIKPKARNPMPDDVRAKLDLKNKLKSKKTSARDKQRLVAEDLGARWG